MHRYLLFCLFSYVINTTQRAALSERSVQNKSGNGNKTIVFVLFVESVLMSCWLKSLLVVPWALMSNSSMFDF